MLTVSVILRELSPFVVKSVINENEIFASDGIMLLEGNEELSGKYIYMGPPDDVLRAVRQHSGRHPVTIMSGGVSDELLALEGIKNINLFIFDLTVRALYKRLHKVISAYFKWTSELSSLASSEDALQSLAEKGSEMLRCPVVILNMGFKLLGGSIPPGFGDPILEELSKNGFLSYESVCALVEEEERLPNPFAPKLDFVSARTGNYTIVRRIYYSGNLVARVIATAKGPVPEECCFSLASDLADHVQHYFLSPSARHYISNTEIGALIADLIEERLTDPEELEQRMKLVPNMTLNKYYHVMVMSFEARPRPIPWNYVINQISQIFPDSYATVYKEDIIILLKKNNFRAFPEYDAEKLTEVLKFYDAYLAIGNYSKFLTSVHPIYVQTKATIRLGKVFRPTPETRIFFYEQYSTYHTIDLCADRAHDSYHNGNLIYLCHPSLITLDRYDKKYATELRPTLYAYLTNDCNTIKAAKELFIHRNTMYYRLGKIEELLGEKLESSVLKERLLFSFHVLEYLEKYRKEDPLVLKTRDARPK